MIRLTKAFYHRRDTVAQRYSELHFRGSYAFPGGKVKPFLYAMLDREMCDRKMFAWEELDPLR
jgi:8-oxo-dGTP pyrophosphatase MutT (NUDIX family)